MHVSYSRSIDTKIHLYDLFHACVIGTCTMHAPRYGLLTSMSFALPFCQIMCVKKWNAVMRYYVKATLSLTTTVLKLTKLTRTLYVMES